MIPIQKVQEIISKYEELEKELSSGKINSKLFANKSKEYSNLGNIISVAKEYINYENNKKDLKQIIEDKSNDTEMIDMAKKDLNELEIKKLNYGQNIRSNKHIGMFGNTPFSTEDHKNYLKHEKIEYLVGLEIDLVYEWELGSMLIFDRTNLHCSSSKIEGKKIGLTTFTKK